MSEFIIRAEETDLFFLFKNYEELVRCKDCKLRGDIDCPIKMCMYKMDDYFYCPYGEKK